MNDHDHDPHAGHVMTGARPPRPPDTAEHGSEHGGGHAGHSDHAAMFRDRFWVSVALMVPVVFSSHMVGDLLGYHVPSWAGWMAPVLGTVLYFYGGWPFLTGAVGELRTRRPGMMTLVAMAITVAAVASALTTLGVSGLMLDFWWELALLVVIMLLGHWLEMRALGQASGALAALAELLPDTAERVDAGGSVTSVALADLRVDDVVLVRSGARVPADGQVSDGSAEVDESTVTGESRPVLRSVGDRVVAGTVATDSAIRVRVQAVGDDTALAGIQRLVAEAQTSKSRAQALADRAAAVLFYFAAAAGAVTFTVWAALGDLTAAVERTVTVLVIGCPHALGLAIPLVIAISTSVSARAGILVKDRLALERMRAVDAVLFDKTGTLTRGEPAVVAVLPVDGVTDAELLGAAGAAESDSEHPLARAILTAARGVGDIPTATGFRSMTGRGVRATVDGRDVAVGGPAMLRELDVTVPAELAGSSATWAGQGA
ncbi:MAG: HAD-IC family P-type ATPase, partial [Pseudonocardia sp.]|nr:HAD-IC family P-type ATPase [Pseudonocardia sp.]